MITFSTRRDMELVASQSVRETFKNSYLRDFRKNGFGTDVDNSQFSGKKFVFRTGITLTNISSEDDLTHKVVNCKFVSDIVSVIKLCERVRSGDVAGCKSKVYASMYDLTRVPLHIDLRIPSSFEAFGLVRRVSRKRLSLPCSFIKGVCDQLECTDFENLEHVIRRRKYDLKAATDRQEQQVWTSK